jgi:hypothetical protein
MTREMLLVSKEKWNKLQKEVQDLKVKEKDGGDSEEKGDFDTGSQPKIPPKEIGTYDEVLSRLIKDLKDGVPGITKGGGSAGVLTKKKTKKRKTRKSLRLTIPPPGVPDNWTPVAKETDTRDLSKKPPYIENWEEY